MDNNIGLVHVNGNPSTTQIILRSNKVWNEMDNSTKPDDGKKDLFCNNCEHFLREERGNKMSCTTRCTARTPRPGGAFRVVKLNVFPDEKVSKPFWCPKIKNDIGNSILSDNRFGFGAYTNKASEEDKSEKWMAISGITSWDDIKVGSTYHMPPMYKRGRMNIYVMTKYCGSLMGENINTGEKVWLYKSDDDFKFLSKIK